MSVSGFISSLYNDNLLRWYTISAKLQLAFAWMWHLVIHLKIYNLPFFLMISLQRFNSIHFVKKIVSISFNELVCLICLMIYMPQALFWRWKIISSNIGFHTRGFNTHEPIKIYLSKTKHQPCVTNSPFWSTSIGFQICVRNSSLSIM